MTANYEVFNNRMELGTCIAFKFDMATDSTSCENNTANSLPYWSLVFAKLVQFWDVYIGVCFKNLFDSQLAINTQYKCNTHCECERVSVQVIE